MPRTAHRAAAGALAAAALAATAAALPPAAPVPALRELLDTLVTLRDGHGARPIPQADDLTRRDP